MKPICVPCRRFYRPAKTGQFFVEAKPRGGSFALVGLAAPEQWEPYKVWSGDLYQCHGCGNEIIVGAGIQPISQDYRPDFADVIKALRADEITINDC